MPALCGTFATDRTATVSGMRAVLTLFYPITH
ncbi:Uncharacterised protein [Vibrio cholerae]|nr:Uncharacterised protein [Vibrio cholerae]